MSKLKIKKCDKCRRPFKTEANWSSTCDYCKADQEIEKDKNDPSSNYYLLKFAFGILEKEWEKKEKALRTKAVLDFWIEFLFINPMSWRRCQYYAYLLDIKLQFQLSKKHFDLIKSSCKKHK